MGAMTTRPDSVRASSFKPELFCAGAVFVVSLFVYSWTLAPTVTLVDSGELIVAAHSLGVGHPPGFPLYLLLAHLASVVPIGTVARRVNFASGVFAALAAAMLTLVVAELIAIASTSTRSKQKISKKREQRDGKLFRRAADELNGYDSLRSCLATIAPALASGLLLAFSRTLWSYATIAEVYTLNTLLIAIIFFLMLRWRRCILEDERWINPKRSSRRGIPVITNYDLFLYTAAVVFGLALGDHHVTVGLTLPAIAVIVYKTQGLRFFTSKRLLYAALFSFAALIAVYSYLPLAASRGPLINWGSPRSLQEIWWHVTGRQYQVFVSFVPELMGKHLAEFGRLALREFGWWWLPLALLLAAVGLANLLKHDRTTFWFLVFLVVCDIAYAVSYDIAEDKDAYYLPAFIGIAIAAGFGLKWLLDVALPRTRPVKLAWVLAPILVLIVPATTLASNWRFNNRRHYFIAHDYVQNILTTIEPNGLLLSLDWQVISPALYTREIEQLRRDVKVIDVQLLRRSWYLDYLRHAYPDLIDRSRDKVDAFAVELKQWEHDPQAYAQSAALTRRIASAFEEMFESFVARELEVAPVYVTSDLILSREELYQQQIRWLVATYQAIPRGLVFQLVHDKDFHDPGNANLKTRGLTDGTLKFDEDDVVNLKVLPVYKAMLLNRGRYLAFFNQHERAIDAFRRALAFDPSFELARQGLGRSMNKLRESQGSP
jgi:tetratricopeptide (TPR) repeat protein